MIFELTISELLIISLFFITGINCALTYFCCTKSLKILETDNSIGKAINRLRILDQYLLSKVNLVVALFYFCLSYLFIESMFLDNDYVFLLACLLSFPLTLITTFASRVCYCYTCNVLLDTKLNEFECLLVNFKRLFVIYLPFLLISFIVPTVYLLGFEEKVSNLLCIGILMFVFVLWIVLTPKIIALNNGAKQIEKNTLLRNSLEKLMKVHNIKRFKLYCWDSSKTREANAMVSGLRTCHLFISSCLIESITLPELETVISHEIGHVKNKHLLKKMLVNLLCIGVLIFMAVVPYIFNFEDFEKYSFYIVAVLFVCLGLFGLVKLERKYEEEADSYAACYNDPKLFASALKKITKDEEVDKNKLDELFQSHPDIKERIERIEKGE